MKPSIFVDGRAFDKYFEGTRTYIENLYKIIDEIGDFDIYIGSESNVAESVFEHSKNIKFVKYVKSKSKLKRALVEIPEIIGKYKINASHFQYVVPPIKNSIQVVTIHDLLFKDFPEHFSFKYRLVKGLSFYLSAVRADIVTTVSAYSKDAIIKHFNLKPADVHIVANGVASTYFENYDKSVARATISNRFGISNYILYVSRIEPRKNQLELLNAYLDLKLYDNDMSLVLIGKEDIPVPELHQIINGLPAEVSKKIYLLSNIDNEDLKVFYIAAKMFVYPSKAEGFGIPPLEAAALKVPTICSNKTAMSDFTFFEPNNHINPDIDHLKQAISYQLGNPDSDNRLEGIKHIIADRYSWVNSATKLNELIWNKVNA
jgi:glycosyltransferase involved in cell wall biosynthesis